MSGACATADAEAGSQPMKACDFALLDHHREIADLGRHVLHLEAALLLDIAEHGVVDGADAGRADLLAGQLLDVGVFLEADDRRVALGERHHHGHLAAARGELHVGHDRGGDRIQVLEVEQRGRAVPIGLALDLDALILEVAVELRHPNRRVVGFRTDLIAEAHGGEVLSRARRRRGHGETRRQQRHSRHLLEQTPPRSHFTFSLRFWLLPYPRRSDFAVKPALRSSLAATDRRRRGCAASARIPPAAS